jgi:hypothetical protein
MLVLICLEIILTFNHFDNFSDVPIAVHKEAMGQFTIPSCPASLLIVTLDRLSNRVVNDEAYVRLVNAHAKGNRGTHDLCQKDN